MTSPPDSPVAPAPVTPPDLPAVAAVVLFAPGMNLVDTLTALDRQVYKPDLVLVVGGGEGEAELAREHGFSHLTDVRDVLANLVESVSFVWWIHGDTVPRPDALSSLVSESVRNDASVAGSKVLIAGAEDRLDSVGSATDAFGEPYSGLDPGELDVEQYDVVREVAFVSPLSMLIRWDLLRGLGGLDPTLPSQAAGLDLSQRARLAGGKVIVVPSSEVFHAVGCPADRPGWRQMAGRQRAMLTAYRPVTLVWVVPIGFLIGIADSLGQLALGRIRPFLHYVLSWLWNLGRLLSTVSSRRALRRIRQTGDEDLFRFQIRGSVRLRETAAELGERLSRVLESGEELSFSDRVRVVWKRPSALLALAAVAALLVGTRTIWLSGLPQTGFSLSPGEDPVSTLIAYSGGWNSSGLGTPNPPPPIAALGAVATLVAGGRPGLAASLLTFGALMAGFAGMVRLTRRIGAGLGAGYTAGVVYLGGAAAAALFGAGQWPLLLAAGPLPWALDAIWAPRPADTRRRLGLIARGSLAAGLAAAAYPPVIGVVMIGGLLWTLCSGRYRSILPTITVAILGAVAIAPWVIGGEVMALLDAAPVPQISPIWLWPTTVGLAFGLLVPTVDRARLPGVVWGGLAAAGGWLVGLLAPLPPGLGLAALLAASLGAGLLAATLIGSGKGRVQRSLAFVALATLTAPAVLTIGGGRAGLPADEWSRRLDFAGAISDNEEIGRVLVFGSPGQLPGESRLVGGVAYRVIDGDRATLEQAYLPGERIGDRALEETVIDLVGATSIRPGSALASFGVSWLVVLPGITGLNDALFRQVDLAPLLVDPELGAFENLAESGRAVTEGGEEWIWTGQRYQGPVTQGRVRLADNADSGWTPDWEQVDWANSVDASQGSAIYQSAPVLQATAVGSAIAILAMVAVAWWGRRPAATPESGP